MLFYDQDTTAADNSTLNSMRSHRWYSIRVVSHLTIPENPDVSGASSYHHCLGVASSQDGSKSQSLQWQQSIVRRQACFAP